MGKEKWAKLLEETAGEFCYCDKIGKEELCCHVCAYHAVLAEAFIPNLLAQHKKKVEKETKQSIKQGGVRWILARRWGNLLNKGGRDGG